MIIWARWYGRATEAARVVCQATVATTEMFDLRAPHSMVERKSMDEHHGVTAA
jgi:hypothetical protein